MIPPEDRRSSGRSIRARIGHNCRDPGLHDAERALRCGGAPECPRMRIHGPGSERHRVRQNLSPGATADI
jgi:hypothetical protein